MMWDGGDLACILDLPAAYAQRRKEGYSIAGDIGNNYFCTRCRVFHSAKP